MKIIAMMFLSVLSIGLFGCTEGAIFGGGLATGLSVKLNEANAAMVNLDKEVTALNDKAKEISVIVKSDPMTIAGAIDPNLKPAMDAFIVNAKSLAEKAEQFKDEKGDIDWLQVALFSVIGLFGGGTGVNLYKNRIVK